MLPKKPRLTDYFELKSLSCGGISDTSEIASQPSNPLKPVSTGVKTLPHVIPKEENANVTVRHLVAPRGPSLPRGHTTETAAGSKESLGA